MSKHFLKLLGAVAVFVAGPLYAQVPTPEGRVITNEVSVAYTDANGNTYADATASVDVIVGFKPGIDVTSPGTVTPATPTAAGEFRSVVFRISNIGNGSDRFQVTGVTVGAGSGTLTVAKFGYNGTEYNDLASLNAALNGAGTDSVVAAPNAGNFVEVEVFYTLQIPGGTTRTINLAARSVRAPSTTDNSTTNVSPPVAGGVSITATNSTISRLPNGTTAAYTTTFQIANGSNASRTFDLTPSVTVGSAVLVSNVAITGGNTVTIGANGQTTVTVSYVVEDVPAGTQASVNVYVAAQTDPANVNATASHLVTVIRADLQLTKEAFRSDKLVPIDAVTDRVLPGEQIWYKLTIENIGDADAYSLVLTDQLPAEVTYNSHTGLASWTMGYNAGTNTVTATRTGGFLAPNTPNILWVSVTIK